MALSERSNIGKKVAALPLAAVNVTTEAKLQESRKRRSEKKCTKFTF